MRTVLNSWGPGRFDGALFIDGKAFRPDGKSASVLIPPAFGLAGVNLHTWTGWGGVSHWNAFVANLVMHGQGTFFDPRLDDATRFPIAARETFGHVRADEDLITPQLPALQIYQLALPAPPAPRGSYDRNAAKRGAASSWARPIAASCHVPPLFTEPGWNMHTAAEIGIDDFQASRSPDGGLPHRSAARAVDAHEGRLLSRRPLPDAGGGHRSLRLAFLVRPLGRRKE